MMTDDLIAFLRARLDDDERKIAAMEREENRVQTAPIFQGHPPNWLAGVDIFVSPKRWRDEVDAKRRILDICEADLRQRGAGALEGRVDCPSWDVIVGLAQPFSSHGQFREEWRLP
jgi:hypothetical protein